MKPDTIVMMSIDDITPYYNNPRYADVILDRYRNLTGEEAEAVDG